MSDERNLVQFMEMCLKEKEYEPMHKALLTSKNTFSQYAHYTNLLEQARIDQVLEQSKAYLQKGVEK